MEQAQVEQRMKNVIGTVLKIDPETIATDANFIFDLGADSMQSLELIAAFEEEFDIEMEEDEALEIQTVSGAVEFISGHLE